MTTPKVTLALEHDGAHVQVEATRVAFSARQCFDRNDSPSSEPCLSALADHLMTQPGLAVAGGASLTDALLKIRPALAGSILCVIAHDDGDETGAHGRPVVATDALPPQVETVFLAETRVFERWRMRRRLPHSLRLIEPDVVYDLCPDSVPDRAWTPTVETIYPIDLPDVDFAPGLDMILIDCPARNLALMPNGLAYVHNALKKTGIAFATFDLDIVAYHRFHMARIFDAGGAITLADGRVLPVDPWRAEHYDLWSDAAVIDHFAPIIEEAAAAIIAARPKILGLSIHQCNELFSRRLVERVKAALPETVIVVGGYTCADAEIGRRHFPEFDYMCVGEADLTIGPLVEALARGERPNDVPGVLSQDDSPVHEFLPGPMLHNLDAVAFPRYEWFDLDLYRNFDGYQLTPIIASRGCRWSQCTFCAERIYWRIRSAVNFVDELEWLVDKGCTLFMFNESDLNGMPDKLLEICDEIIRRGIKVRLTGQLRIHNRSDRDFFDKLSAAGFVALRFGVDAFSRNTLKLQMKGYTPETISQNLRDCWQAGIFTEVNWVIGVPGETEADVEEGIALIRANRDFIGRVANINPLILTAGSVYWLDPEKHGIRFRRPKSELYAAYPYRMPADHWYSDDPFIDAGIRKQWFERIVLALNAADLPMGEWATRIVADVTLARDRNRAGLAEPREPEAEDATVSSVTGEGGMVATDPGRLGEKESTAVRGDVSSTGEAASKIDNARTRQKKLGSDLRAHSEMAAPDDRPALAPGGIILRFDGAHYAIDPGALETPLAEAGDTAILSSRNLCVHRVVTDDELPRLLCSIETYNVVYYQGWVYGIPQGLGELDLREVDVMSMPGIVRGVSRERVEHEVQDILDREPDPSRSALAVASAH